MIIDMGYFIKNEAPAWEGKFKGKYDSGLCEIYLINDTIIAFYPNKKIKKLFSKADLHYYKTIKSIKNIGDSVFLYYCD
jgi:hypothetical protein